MATVTTSPFSSPLHSICFSRTLPSLAFRNVPISTLKPVVPLKAQTSRKSHNHRLSPVKAVEEENQIGVQEKEPSSTSVVVPIFPPDTLTMLFQAEGTMNETAIPSLTNALQETQVVSNLKIQIVEGIASIELKKQITVQASAVASGLVETIQGSGFKLQTLNLSFVDEEGATA